MENRVLSQKRSTNEASDDSLLMLDALSMQTMMLSGLKVQCVKLLRQVLLLHWGPSVCTSRVRTKKKNIYIDIYHRMLNKSTLSGNWSLISCTKANYVNHCVSNGSHHINMPAFQTHKIETPMFIFFNSFENKAPCSWNLMKYPLCASCASSNIIHPIDDSLWNIRT